MSVPYTGLQKLFLSNECTSSSKVLINVPFYVTRILSRWSAVVQLSLTSYIDIATPFSEFLLRDHSVTPAILRIIHLN